MTLIVVKNKKVLSIPALQRVVLKSIYQPKNLSYQDRTEMEHSIVTWKQSLDMKQKYKIMNAIDEECLIQLQEICFLIRENEEGRLDGRKEMFLRNGIDYRKFHKLEEAFEKKDFVVAAAMKKEYDEKNPEQEGLK